MALPDVVSRDEWMEARTALLVKEKAMTRARDALNTERRELPMVEITEDYRFQGPDGEVTLLDLFDGRRQLILGHFMFDPSWDDGCPSCTAGVDEVNQGLLDHLAKRDTTLAYASRAPIEKIERYRAKRGWDHIRWVSSYGTHFNHDFGVTIDESVRDPAMYNFREVTDLSPDDQPAELPGRSCFLRDGDRVFHTYSDYARGAESTGGSYYFLDLTALGRQEEWEQPKDRSGDARAAQPDFQT